MLIKNENAESKFMEIVLLLLLVYSFLGYLFPENINYIMLILAASAILLNTLIEFKKIITIRQLILICLILIFISIQLLPAAYSIFPENSLNTSISRSIILFIGILLCLQNKWHEKGIKLVFIFSLIHVTATLFSYLFPTIFQGTIVPLLPDNIRSEAALFISNNVYSGITEQVGRNAFYISVGISVLISYILIKPESKNKLHIPFIIIAFGIFLLALLLTGKRGHLLANLFSMLVVFGVYTKIRGKRVITKLTIFIVGIGILLWLLINLFPQAAAPFLRFIEREGGDQTSGRIQLYSYAIEMFKEKPLLGWGTGIYNNLYDIGTHNIYLQLLSENGLIGFISFSLILLFNLINTFNRMKSSFYLRALNYTKYLLFSLYIQVFFIVYGMTGNPLNDGFILIIYLIAASIPYTLNVRERVNAEVKLKINKSKPKSNSKILIKNKYIKGMERI